MVEFLVEKIGMSRTVSVPSIPVTLLRVHEIKVCEVKKDGKALVAYSDGKKINKAILGQQAKFNLSKEFNKFMTIRVAEDTKVGDLDTTPLNKATLVKTSFITKGRGFSGGMKRHNFGGGPASHGHRFGRRIGSIGNAEWPGRVQKGRKMPGQYGNTKNSVRNDVVSYDAQNGILVLKGSVSGHNGAKGLIRIVK
jgi:large subunit ribosomal protein L3